jgi:hypothetical protein
MVLEQLLVLSHEDLVQLDCRLLRKVLGVLDAAAGSEGPRQVRRPAPL